jgi:predicted Fe-Mo cluster-binding NifX family protein
MRIAISSENNQVADHFGRCSQYTIVDIENSEVKEKKVVDNPGHAPGTIPEFLKEKGCDIIIAGGMGRRAQGYFQQFGIDYIIGVHGNIEDVIRNYLNDTLEAGESSCDHGQGHGDGTHGHKHF